MIRRTAPLLAAVLLAVLVLGPALAPGYVLQYDMVFVPRQWLLPASFGLGGQLPRAVPQDAVLGALTAVLPGSVWQHLALLAVVVVGALGAARLLRGQPVLARVAAALLLVWSPYVAQRLLLGSWSLLLAVALLPWALQAAVDVRAARPGAGPRLLLLVGLSSITPTGGLLALAVAGPVALRPRSRPTARNRVLLGLGLLALQLPWVVPSVLHPASAASDPAGASVFALRAEGWWGPLVTALGTGGVWNGEVVLPTRGLVLAPLAALLLTALAAAGLAPLSRVVGRAAAAWLGVCAATGLLVAVLGAWGPTRPLVEQVVASVPGGGLLRDGQKWLAPWTLLVAIAAPLGLQRGVARMRDRTAAAALGVALVLLPVAVMPDLVWGGLGRMRTTDYPQDWSRTAEALQVPGDGDVVVLPWSAFRAFAWNRRTTSLDPAPRFLPRTTVVDDSLLVAGPDGLVRVSGEDPRSTQVAAALAAGRPLMEVLPGLGVRYVVVEHETPGDVPPPALAGLDRVSDGPTMSLWSLPGRIAPPPSPSTASVALVAAAYLLAGLVLVTAAARSAMSWRGGRRKPRRPATVR